MKPQLQLPRRTIWRRELPVAGRLLVSPGDSVEPDTPIGEAEVPVAPFVISLENARPLVEAGQTVHAGVVVAERKKLLGHGDELRSPVPGTVLRVTGTELLLQPPPLSTTLSAQLPGSVAAIRDGSGVDVEGCYAIVRGRGRVPQDVHGRLGDDIAIVTEPLTISRLHALAEQGMRAIIAPCWADAPEPSWVDESPAVFLTEPRIRPMMTPIANLLQAHLGVPAALTTGCRPLLAIALEADQTAQAFGHGSWVRLADGRAGRIAAIGGQPRFFPSGIRAVPAEVDLGDSTETVALDSLDWVA
jgi:hypothetical protein